MSKFTKQQIKDVCGETMVKKKFEGIHDIGKLPDGYEYSCGDIYTLCDDELGLLEKEGITTAVYWYANGSYEGLGQMIYKSNDGWASHDMSHCSCYGPIDHLNPRDGKDIDELYNNGTEEFQKEIKELYDYIKERI